MGRHAAALIIVLSVLLATSGCGKNGRLRSETIDSGREIRLLGLHRIAIQNPGQSYWGAKDFCTMGANGTIEGLSLEKVQDTVDSILWRQSWRFIKRKELDRDTLDIVRTVRLRRDEPYFRLRYEFTWIDVEPESLRYIWHLQRGTRLAKGRSMHEVGYAPGYGMVVARHAFDASTLGWAAGHPASPPGLSALIPGATFFPTRLPGSTQWATRFRL